MLLVELAPRALHDLRQLPAEISKRILDDLELLRALPWPGPPKVKRLHGTPYSRLRIGEFRSIVLREGSRVTVLRVIARKDLDRTLRTL